MGDRGRAFAGNGRWREAIPARILARMPRGAQPARRAAHLPPRPHSPLALHEYAFLIGPLIDAGTLRRAEAEALDCGVAAHEVLLAAGWVSQDDYAAALARKLGVPVVSWGAELDVAEPERGRPVEIGLRTWRAWAPMPRAGRHGGQARCHARPCGRAPATRHRRRRWHRNA